MKVFDAQVEAMIALGALICFWCGQPGHMIKDCTKICTGCGARPNSGNGGRSEHKPGCKQTLFRARRSSHGGTSRPSDKTSRRPPKPNSAYYAYKRSAPREARQFKRNFRNARKIKGTDRSKGQQRIVHFANALGLQEDDDLSSDSGYDTDRDSDGRPADLHNTPAPALQDFQFVAQSDLGQPLTHLHPAEKAVDGPTAVSESTMAYDAKQQANNKGK